MAVVMERNGKRMFKHKQQLFGAKGGLIYIFDERDGTTACCDVVEFQARADALGLEAARCIYGTERTELENAANDMEAAIQDAIKQGDPTDVKVQEWHAKHSKKKPTILVGQGTAKLSGPSKLPPPPKHLLKGARILT
jgi:hypothetical protein